MDSEKPDSQILDFERHQSPGHGAEGHTGYRCGSCAAESGVAILAAPDTGNYWQNLQIAWQEQCDILFNQFDDAVATHFPLHTGPGCKTCPTKPEMPPKPIKPNERALKQNVQ